MSSGVGTFGNSGAGAQYANGAEGPMPLIAGPLLAGGHGSRRTFLVTVEQDEHAQV